LDIGDKMYLYRSIAGMLVGIFMALLDRLVGGMSGYGSTPLALVVATILYVFTIPLFYGWKAGAKLSTAYLVFKGITGYYVSWFLTWTILYNYGIRS
jgi:hypothetical protein